MNRIHIIVAIKASNSIFPPLRTVLFSTRGREIAKPSKIPRMYNTRASLDSRKMSLMQKQRQAIGVWLQRRWNHLETELFSGT
ncbi:hypothetical protein HanPI659440_Chr03g0127111 [Helianthus annuus]|nr:hypothetical protein HanPI659440_Chr03g0127111 [Helianthus annuus]